MKIGGLFGFTAPMLLILRASGCDLDVRGAAGMLNNAVDCNLLQSCRAEIECFRQAVCNLPKRYHSEYDEVCAKLPDYSKYSLKAGKLIPKVESEEIADGIIEIFQQTLLVKLTYTIMEYPDDFLLSVGSFQRLIDFIIQWCQNHDVRFSKVNTEAKNMLKEISTNGSFPCGQLKQVLRTELGVEAEIDTEKMGLNKNEAKIVSFFVKNVGTLTDLDLTLKETDLKEAVVFGLPFRDIMNSNPDRLLRIVETSFASVKDMANQHFFKTVYRDCSDDFEIFKEQFEKSVVVFGNASDTRVVTEEKEKVSALIATMPARKSDFFQIAFKQKVLPEGEITSENFQLLSELYNAASLLRKDVLNSLLEVQMSDREWMETGLHLSEFNLGGLSLHTLQLFQESLSTITFSMSGKIFRTPELVEQHKKNIANIQSLLDTMLPVGVEI